MLGGNVVKKIIWVALLVLVGINLFAGVAFCKTEKLNINNLTDYTNKCISADGRYITYHGFVDGTEEEPLFILDRDTGVTTRLPQDGGGTKIAPDGKNVFFYNNIDYGGYVKGIYDREADNIVVSFRDGSSPVETANAEMSNDGKFIAYVKDLFIHLYNVTTGSDAIMSTDFRAISSCISGNGKYIFYNSMYSNYITRIDTSTGIETHLVTGNAQISGKNFEASQDGQKIAFLSDDNYSLVDGDNNGVTDVFIYDIQKDILKRISVSNQGEQANGASGNISFSDNGRYVAFSSAASNLVPGDTNGKKDIFVYDLDTNTINRISISDSGNQFNFDCTKPSISADGTYVVFGNGINIYLWTKDIEPPITDINLTGTQGKNGWYTSDVQIRLSATDDLGSSNVAQTVYSFDNQAWYTYTAPFTVSAEGITKIYYYSKDKNGNTEIVKTSDVKIDKTKPRISISYAIGSGTSIKDELLPLKFNATDSVSGIAGGPEIIWNAPDMNPSGQDSLEVYVEDQAGNRETRTLNFSWTQ